MFGIFKRKQPADTPDDLVLPFKSAEAAFEYCCRFMDCKLTKDTILPAMVLDARKELGAESSVSRNPNGIQSAAIRIPSDDGGFLVMSEALSANGPILVPGQLVAWRALLYSMVIGDGIAQAGGDARSGWIGMIVATLIPTWSRGVWTIDQKFKH